MDARNTLKGMAIALRNRYNRRYEAVIGRIRAKIRVKNKKKESFREETDVKKSKTMLPVDGTHSSTYSGVKFLLAKTFA